MRALGPKYYNTDALGGFQGFVATVFLLLEYRYRLYIAISFYPEP